MALFAEASAGREVIAPDASRCRSTAARRLRSVKARGCRHADGLPIGGIGPSFVQRDEIDVSGGVRSGLYVFSTSRCESRTSRCSTAEPRSPNNWSSPIWRRSATKAAFISSVGGLTRSQLETASGGGRKRACRHRIGNRGPHHRDERKCEKDNKEQQQRRDKHQRNHLFAASWRIHGRTTQQSDGRNESCTSSPIESVGWLRSVLTDKRLAVASSQPAANDPRDRRHRRWRR